jgi:hypothetical protein
MSSMATKILLATLVVLRVATASAQLSPSTFTGIPLWADSALRTAGLEQRFTLSSRLNPVYEFGDFDRDGLLDLAVEIIDTGGLRCGIAIVHRIDRSVHIVGAGHPLGNGQDRIARRGDWTVLSPRQSRRHRGFGPDLLYAREPGGHSGWLVWDGHSYRWIQAEGGP